MFRYYDHNNSVILEHKKTPVIDAKYVTLWEMLPETLSCLVLQRNILSTPQFPHDEYWLNKITGK